MGLFKADYKEVTGAERAGLKQDFGATKTTFQSQNGKGALVCKLCSEPEKQPLAVGRMREAEERGGSPV